MVLVWSDLADFNFSDHNKYQKKKNQREVQRKKTTTVEQKKEKTIKGKKPPKTISQLPIFFSTYKQTHCLCIIL